MHDLVLIIRLYHNQQPWNVLAFESVRPADCVSDSEVLIRLKVIGTTGFLTT